MIREWLSRYKDELKQALDGAIQVVEFAEHLRNMAVPNLSGISTTGSGLSRMNKLTARETPYSDSGLL